MPELPEVETVRMGLQRLIVGKTIKSIKDDNFKSFPNDTTEVKMFVIGARVIKVRRRAKVLIIDLSTKYSLVVHLRMTGQLVFAPAANRSASTPDNRWGGGHPNDSLIGELPDKSTRVILDFADETTLFFNDQRKFGWMKLLPTVEVPNMPFMQKVGPEPLLPDFSFDVFNKRLQKRKNTTIKAALLDQTVLAGIGNIYADESLFLAGIHSSSRVASIPVVRLRALHKSIINVLTLSLQKGGSTDRNYVNAEGKKGSYIDFAKVFRKEGQPCQKCGNEIIKIRVAGRGTHVCTKCQKVYN